MSIDYSGFAYPKPPKKEKKIKKRIKGKKHNSTKQYEISVDVKIKVWERDRHECIFCHKKVDWRNANAHFIPRSAGGLGIEQNVFTACDICHIEQDNGLNTEKYDNDAKNYLKRIYGDEWSEKDLIYHKY